MSARGLKEGSRDFWWCLGGLLPFPRTDAPQTRTEG